MSNAIKLTKQAFTWSVVVTTILWSMGIAAFVPLVAQAEGECTFEGEAGDLIQFESTEKGAPVYLLNAKGERLYFPSEEVYASWYGKDFSGVNVISVNCVNAFPAPSQLPLGVNYRPGSQLVKVKIHPDVYVIEPGNKKAKLGSEGVAKALYGDNWSTKVRDVADEWWSNFTSTGDAVTEAKPHEGMLLQVTGGTKTYTVKSGKLVEVSGTLLSYEVPQVVAQAVFDAGTMGEGTVETSSLTDDPAQGGPVVQTPAPTPAATNTSTPAAPVGGDLTVGLSANTPAGAFIPNGTAFNSVLKFNLVAGAKDAKVTGVKVKKLGFASNAAIEGLMLMDSAGVQHGNTVSSLGVDATTDLLFSSSPVVVKTGDTDGETLTLQINVATSTTSGDMSFSVIGVTTDGGTVSGLPVTGNSFSLTSGSGSVFAATVEITNSVTSTVNLDAKSQDAFKFKVSLSNSNEDAWLEKLMFYNAGTAADSDFGNVTLYNQKGDAIAVAEPKNKYVTLDLSAAPFMIKKGESETFTVKLNVISGASRTIRLTIQENDDLMIKGGNTKVYVLTTGSTTGLDSTFPLGNGINTLTVGSGTLTLSEGGTPTANLAAGESSVVLGKFKLKANGEKMQLRKMAVAIVSKATHDTNLVNTVFVKVDGVIVFSAAPSTFTTSTGYSTDGSLGTAKTMSTYYTLPADKEVIVEIIGSLSSSATTADGYAAAIDVTEVKRESTNDIVDPATARQVATVRTVSSANLKVVNINFNAGTYNVIKSTSEVALAKFTVEASSSGENVRINSLVFSDNDGGTTPALADITNLKIFETGVAAAYETSNSTASITSSSTITFTFKTPIIVKKTEALRTFWLKGDMSSGATTGATHKFEVKGTGTTNADSDIVGAETSSAADTVSGTGQTVTVAGSGTLNVAVSYASGHTEPKNETVQVGTAQKQFTVFKFRANDENVKVTELVLTLPTSTATYTDFGNVSLYLNDAATAFITVGQCSSGSKPTTCTFSSSDKLFEVPAGTDVYVRVKADVLSQSAAKLANKLSFTIRSLDTNLTAIGKTTLGASSKTGTGDVGAIYKQIVPFSVVITGYLPTQGSTQVKTIGSGTEVGSFQVKNNGTAAITLGTTTIYDSGTNGTSGLFYDIYKSDANSVAISGSVVASSTKAASGALAFSTGDMSAIIIQSGQYITLTIKVRAVGDGPDIAVGNSFRLYVSALGDIQYSVTESGLGYDGTIGNGTNDTVTELNVTGEPQLGETTKA